VTALFRNLLRFGRLLHDAGLDVHAGRMVDVAQALDVVDIGRREDFYHTLRTLLVHRPQDLPAFDAAFLAFWREPHTPIGQELRAMGRQRRLGPPQAIASPRQPQIASDSAPVRDDVQATHVVEGSYSASEVLRAKDFADLTDDELSDARRMVADLRWNPGERRTRRRTPARSRTPDWRRLVRANVRFGGEPLAVPTTGRKTKPRGLVVIADVSGSMERYARMLLHFVQSVASGRPRLEAFVFATRFTRITREVRRGGIDATSRIPARVPDWGGGTRIGDAIGTFNRVWARRVLSHRPVVLLISDGWDRGDPDVLRREIARLQRGCHRLIWLNPLIGSPGYQPMTRGLQAALPFVDDFLPAHNVDSLASLGAHLNQLTSAPNRSVVRPVQRSTPAAG
jgi:uncharacterized protein with von Willebrand factor type A (vWA) domain